MAASSPAVLEAEKQAILADAGLLRRTLDASFLADPVRDRRFHFQHFTPQALTILFVKHTALGALGLATEIKPPKIPYQDPLAMVEFTVQRLRKPVIRDVLHGQAMRYIEGLIVDKVYPGQPEKYGRYVTDATAAAKDVWVARRELLPEDASVLDYLAARLDAAKHVTCHVAWQPALVDGLATLVVEEAMLVAERAYDWYRRREAARVIVDEKATADEKKAAHEVLVPADIDAVPPMTLAMSSLDVAIRSGLQVVATVASHGVGTFVYPGVANFVLTLVSGLVVWI